MSDEQSMCLLQVSAEEVVPVAKSLGHISPEVLEDWRKRASEQRLTMLAAKVGDEFVGSVNLILDGADEQVVLDEVGSVPMINALGVLMSFRRRGIADSLLEAAEKLASNYSDIVILGVGIDNYAARRLYGKRGYVPREVRGAKAYVSTWPGIDESGNSYMESEECVLMVKEL